MGDLIALCDALSDAIDKRVMGCDSSAMAEELLNALLAEIEELRAHEQTKNHAINH